MAQWTLAVRPSGKPVTTLTTARLQQEPSFSISEKSRGDAVADGALDSACDHGASHGRWLLDVSTGKYRWEFLPYAPPLPPPSHWVSALASRGIREINFVGDSHQRFLMLHLAYLIIHTVNDSHVDYHGDISISVPGPAPAYDTAPRGDDVALDVRRGLRGRGGMNQQQEQQKWREFGGLKLNFYWVDGIYQNGQFGCERRGFYSGREDSFPNISKTADVTIIDAGAWSGLLCQEPERAYSVHLPAFLEWANGQRRKAEEHHQSEYVKLQTADLDVAYLATDGGSGEAKPGPSPREGRGPRVPVWPESRPPGGEGDRGSPCGLRAVPQGGKGTEGPRVA
ncbi:unnamed protein product [Closterium sp. NIES-65]|nr:unnamed protein product [Closterium sp. NIES-65]